MRKIVSPLSGIQSPLGLHSGLSAFAVNSVEAQIVFDAATGTYKKNAANTNYSGLFTAGGASLKTQVNSAGELVWAPHNLLTYSEDISNSAWLKNDVTVGGSVTSPSGASLDLITENTANADHSIYRSVNPSGTTTFTFEVKANGCRYIQITNRAFGSFGICVFDLDTGLFVQNTAGRVSATSLGDGFYQLVCDESDDGPRTNAFAVFLLEDTTPGDAFNGPSYTGDGSSGIYVGAKSFYRSDLGGMADNPDRGDSYVPTTSSAVYMGRTDHHRYNGSAWVNKGIYLESEARTNVQQYSIPDSTNYIVNDITVTNDAATSPDGTTNAASLVPTAIGGTHRIFNSGWIIGGGVSLAHSAFVKANGYDQVALRENSLTGTSAVFDLSTGTVGGTYENHTVTIANTSIEDWGNGWYRISMSTNDSGTGSQSLGLYVLDGGWTSGDPQSYSFTGDGTSGIYAYGLQLEEVSAANPFPSSYIPTNGASVTRAAETLQIDAANMPAYTDAVSIYMRGEVNYADANNYTVKFFNWEFDVSDRIFADLNTTSSKTGSFEPGQSFSWTIDVAVVPSGTQLTPGRNVPFAISSRHLSNAVNGALNGTAATANTTPTALADLSAADFEVPSTNFNGTISELRVFAGDIGDTGLEEVTS